jgi:glycosyltransferase involved in cell wall biosynthesis
MRVLHVYKTYLPETIGGIEQVIFQMCQSGIEHGIEAEVLTLTSDRGPSEVMVAGHRVHRVKRDLQIASTGMSYSILPKLKALARNFDIINYHFPWPMMDLLHFAARINKPFIVSYHSDIVRQKHLLKLYRPLMERFLGKADHILASSPNYLESSEVLKRYQSKTSLMPYGLYKEDYPVPSADRLNHWQQRFGKRFFLFVGVMRYYKGLHTLLDAAKGSEYPIVIAGAGPLEKGLRSQAQAFGLSNVHFVGAVDDTDKVALLSLCSTFVFPSHLRSEAFGISLLESAMYGKSMISCEIGTGTTYINIDGETGLVVEPENPAALRAAMDHLWNNPEQAEQMGKCAEQRYQQFFTAQRMGQLMAEVYQQVLSENTPKQSA